MPAWAVRAGVADVTAPLPALAAELLRVARHPYVRRGSTEVTAGGGDALTTIFVLVRARPARTSASTNGRACAAASPGAWPCAR